jgi:hypothetical protein
MLKATIETIIAFGFFAVMCTLNYFFLNSAINFSVDSGVKFS